MKKLFLFLLVVALAGFVSKDRCFPYTDYEQVVVYRMTGTEYETIIHKGKLVDQVIEGSGHILDQAEIEELSTIVGDTTNYNDELYKCFNPRHGIVFYNRVHEPVAHLTICLECYQVIMNPGLRTYSLTEENDIIVKQENQEIKGFTQAGLKKYRAFMDKIYPKKD